MSLTYANILAMDDEDSPVTLANVDNLTPSTADLSGTPVYYLDPEEVGAEFPDAVATDPEGTAVAIHWDRLCILLLAALQDLRARVVVLED